jgi:MFS family permease
MGRVELRPQHRIFGAFFLLGVAYGSIFTRIDEIQVAMAAGQGAIGAALIGTAVGMMIAVTFLAPYFDRFGYRRVLLLAMPLMGVLITLASLSPNLMVLFAWLLVFGMAAGTANTIINVEADRTEAVVGHRIMNRCHAIYSGGFLASSLIGAAAKQFSVPPVLHFLGLTILLLVMVFALWNGFKPAPPRSAAGEAAEARFALPTAAVLLLGAFTLAGMIYEGAAADWGVIYMRDVFDAPAFVNGLALSFGSLSQALSRFYSDRFVERYGPVQFARGMLAILGIGALVVTLSPFWALTLLGFALMGIGNAVIMPLAISAAARRTDRPAALNVAALTQLSWIAFFAGPPVIGFAAEHLGSRFTFGLALPLVLLSAVLAPMVLRDVTKASEARAGV